MARSIGVYLNNRRFGRSDSLSVYVGLNIALNNADPKTLSQSNDRFFDQSGFTRSR